MGVLRHEVERTGQFDFVRIKKKLYEWLLAYVEQDFDFRMSDLFR